MTDVFATRAWIDGQIATASDLAPLAFAGFAHFTAMQVRDRRVRGLDLHLERLRDGSGALFGSVIPEERIREALRIAIADAPGDLSLTATVFSRSGEFRVGDAPDECSILVRTFPPSDGPAGPLKLALTPHERWRPELKHVGESAKTYFLREAARQGFDDAAFVDHQGRIGEATIWNLAFWDGATVTWPQADILAGVTMGILRRRLTALGVPQRDAVIPADGLSEFAGAVAMNSWTPGIAVASIATSTLPRSGELIALLHRAYRTEPALVV
ncbi:branched-chain amino acid aminotransferase [Methylobacterium sp. W2]|uniref:aminotransferase class IV family protein n=1 Tax=Methylobacterium sp. W2 TaxID=2598107 RepID=UPI001D0C503F|nr:aminotransferase class IV family protein [Methylobacterium sp. W2]MCC0805838.1 branched-chain amino acid aminotransferase [Methylobacterium sp. W2]